jgi:Na+/H+ antiporter NhaC
MKRFFSFILLIIPCAVLASEANVIEGKFGILSLLPPLVAIGLALAIKQVLPSLLIGVFLGATIYHSGNPFVGMMRVLDEYFVGSLADKNNASIVMFSMMLGGMVGVISRCGGSAGIVEKISKFAKTPKSGIIASWAVGMIIFFDDYASTLITGNTMRPFTDKLKVSREKLSYIVDATSAPIASIAIISTWIGFEMGLIGDAFTKLGIEKSVYLTFVESIPYRFYAVLALLLIPLITIMGRDIGPMLKAERRARATGKVLRDGAIPLADDITPKGEIKASNMWNGLAPILLVIILTGVGLYWSGYQRVGPAPLPQIIGAANSFAVLMWSAFCCALVAVIMAVANSPLKFGETMKAFVDGVKSMVLAIMILILAWSLGSVCEDLGTAEFVSGAVSGALAPWMVPALTFIISASISFATGTSWGTMAILVPIIIPVAYNFIVPQNLAGTMEGVAILNRNWHLMLASIGSVLAGSVFGDHCSPISDTTIMSSMTSACDHIDHVRTQMPYAMLVAVTGVIIGDIPSGLGLNPFISIVIALAVMGGIMRIFGKKWV